MNQHDVNKVSSGLYILYWDEKEGGGQSLAAVGRDEYGCPWFAPTNWISVPCKDWSAVSGLKRIDDEIEVE